MKLPGHLADIHAQWPTGQCMQPQSKNVSCVRNPHTCFSTLSYRVNRTPTQAISHTRTSQGFTQAVTPAASLLVT